MANQQLKIEVVMDESGAITGIKRLTEQTDDHVKKSKPLLQTLKQNWLMVTGVVVSAFMTIKKAFNLGKEFADFEEATQNMQERFGVSADLVIAKLKEVSQGTVNNKDIVMAANKAMAMGVTTDVNQLAELFGFAKVKAEELGISTTDAFAQITESIARGTPRALVGMGIVSKGLMEEGIEAGKTLTKHQLLNVVLDKAAESHKRLGEQTMSSADKYDKLQANTDNFFLTIGKGINSFLNPLITKFMELTVENEKWQFFMAQAPMAFERLQLKGKLFADTIIMYFSKIKQAVKGDLIGALKSGRDEYAVLQEEFKKKDTEVLNTFLENYKKKQQESKATNAVIIQNSAIVNEKLKLDESEREKMNSAVNEAIAQDDSEKTQLKIDKLNEYKEKYQLTANEIININNASAELEKQKSEEVKQKKLKDLQDTLDTTKMFSDSAGGILTAFTALSNQLIDNKSKNEKDAMRKKFQMEKKLFIVNQLVALSQIGIDTATAIIKFLANPGGVAGAALSIAAGIQGGLQTAIVASKKPPKFPELRTGGLVNALVGENGPEMVSLPHGARVFNASETAGMLRGSNGSNYSTNNTSNNYNQGRVFHIQNAYVQGNEEFDDQVNRRRRAGGSFT